ncbi:MAG: trypsin-like peptidase domain-containing protein [Chloroflexi bacterium]|nr:trypsin-like peptidase domain-containing protein [Chloroflexota bacterium]
MSLALFTTAIIVACEDATLVEPRSVVGTLAPTADINATVQAAISATALSTDSLDTAVALAISETSAAQPAPTETPAPAASTPTPNPTVDVRPVVLPQATISPTAVPTPTEIPTPTPVPPTPTQVPSPPPPIVLPSVTPTPTITPVPTSTPTATPAPLSLDQLIAVSSSAVVRISSSIGVGSGVIFRLVGTEAVVLTNQHVVGTSSSVTVLVNDFEEFTGNVVSTDISRDLAVVRICCSADFFALEFANPDKHFAKFLLSSLCVRFGLLIVLKSRFRFSSCIEEIKPRMLSMFIWLYRVNWFILYLSANARAHGPSDSEVPCSPLFGRSIDNLSR